MNDVVVRKFTEADRCTIKRITEQDYYDIFLEYSSSNVELIIVEGITVGWVYLSVPESSLYSGFIFIYISTEHRRKGIGTYVYRIAEKQLKECGCNWWSSYPESKVSDEFALSVGFDYTSTNSYLTYEDGFTDVDTDGIRICRSDDYSAAMSIWSNEYADMHIKMGLPHKKKELTDKEQQEEYEDFCKNVNDYFVIEEDKKVVGMGRLFSDNSGIGSLAVDSQYSGKGYGTRLALFLTNECMRRGRQSPCIYCETKNENAMHIYRKIGYVERSRESVALKG